MSPEIFKLLALRYMHRVSADDVIKWAILQLEAGHDSDALLILAGLSKPYNEFEVDRYFQRSLIELGYTLPQKQEEVIYHYIQDIARGIVTSPENLFSGCQEIAHIATIANVPETLIKWIGFAEDITLVKDGLIRNEEVIAKILVEARKLSMQEDTASDEIWIQQYIAHANRVYDFNKTPHVPHPKTKVKKIIEKHKKSLMYHRDTKEDDHLCPYCGEKMVVVEGWGIIGCPDEKCKFWKYGNKKRNKNLYPFNVHLLQLDLTVEEYERIMPSIRYNPEWRRLPAYTIARCPYCSTRNIEKIDTYSTRIWRIFSSISTVSESVFYHNLVVHHCNHFVVTQIFFDFHGATPSEFEGKGLAGKRKPYVIGHLLESSRCLAVMHALPICRIEGDNFVPSYSLLMISYFSQNSEEAILDVYRYNDDWYTLEASGTLFLPLQYGEKYWADLPRWIAAEQLYWVDGNDSNLDIHTKDIEAFPFRNLVSQ